MNENVEKDFRNSIASKIYAFSLLVFLVGVYLCPEYIKLFSVAYVLFAFAYAILSKVRFVVLAPSFFCWIFFCILGLLFCNIYGIGDFFESIEFVVAILIGLLSQIFYADKKTRRGLLAAIFGVTVIAIIGCVLQLVAPGFLMKFNAITLGEAKYKTFYEFYTYGLLTGFSYQTGVTGFYLGILSGFALCELLFNKKSGKIRKLIFFGLFIVGYVFILLTAKRSVLLVVLALTFLFVCYANRNHWKRIAILTSCMAVGVVLLLCFTEVGRSLIERTLGSSPTSGRDVIYAQLLELIWDKPIFGQGFGSTLALIEGYTNGHNIYLQVLSENGIVGFLLIGLAFVYNFIISLKVLRRADDDDKKTVMICIYLQIYFLALGMFANPLYDVYPLIVYMVSVGIIQHMYCDIRRQSSKRLPVDKSV